LVRIIFEKIRVFPIVMSYLWEEPIFLLFGPLRRNISNGKVVHNVSKPRERGM